MGFDVTVRTNTMSCQHYAMFKRFGTMYNEVPEKQTTEEGVFQ